MDPMEPLSHRGQHAPGENLGAMSMKVLVLWVKEDQWLGEKRGEVTIRLLNIAMEAMAHLDSWIRFDLLDGLLDPPKLGFFYGLFKSPT